MENEREPDYLDDPSKYFTQDEWNNISAYEKLRIQNTYEIYVEMAKSGFIMAKPDFMSRKKELPKVQQQPLPIKTNSKNSVQRSKRTRGQTNNDLNIAENANEKERYPKRSVSTKNYKEVEIIPDDYYVYCDLCMNEYVDKCTIHEPVHLPDNQVPLSPRNPNRARATVPPGWLNISSSKILNGGEGVWALRKIKMGVRFGPYEGISDAADTDGKYSWQIKKDGKVMCYIDGKDTCKANWMRFVNCARNKSEQNLMAYQYRGKIYYRAIVDISPGTELLVFYGPQFARELGIDTKNFNSPPEQPLKDNIFECKKCHLGFSSPIYLEKHVGRCSNKKNCATDKKNIKKPRNESTSDNNNNNNESYKCHLCTMIYTVKSLYDWHLMVKHSIYKDNPESHSKIIQDCEKTTDDNSTSNDSGSSGEPGNEGTNRKRPHKCSDCQRAFPDAWQLERHSRVHTGERPFKCQTCLKTFTWASSLKLHKDKVHTNVRAHECDVCHKTFNRKDNLIVHKRIHDNVRPYQCSVCDQTFTNSHVLSVHMRRHTGEKPYACHICKYRSAQAGHLKTHIRTHTGEKPYACHICKYKCTESGHLKRHIRIHTGKRPYSCQHCQKTFTHSNSLSAHKRTQHTNEESCFKLSK